MVKGKVKKKEWYAGQVHENAKPFRETIQSFCEEYGAALDIEKEGVTAWEIRIVCEEKCGVLYIYEESVVDTAPVCDQCRIIGKAVLPHVIFHFRPPQRFQSSFSYHEAVHTLCCLGFYNASVTSVDRPIW